MHAYVSTVKITHFKVQVL